MVRSVLWTVVGALVVGTLAGALGIVGVTVGAGSLSVGASVAGRTVCTLVVLSFAALLLARRGPWSWAPPVAGVCALGFLLDPLTWTAGAEAGGPLFGVALTGSTVLGLLLDLVVWLAVATGSAWVGVGARDDAVV